MVATLINKLLGLTGRLKELEPPGFRVYGGFVLKKNRKKTTERNHETEIQNSKIQKFKNSKIKKEACACALPRVSYNVSP